ncbi:MAG TPA: four helix bundle protein [Ignavibacteriaceae bacterium]|nr:four helix bundle protein [Ignavibacteriaceae bacterium]
MNRGYRKLEVWIEAIELFKLVRKKTKNLPELNYKIRNQIKDSAFSISSNIAEGHCRRFLKENIQFNNIALGSMGENYTQIFALFYSEDIDDAWFNEYDKLHYSLENKLLNLNKSFIQKLQNNENWESDYKIKELTKHYS